MANSVKRTSDHKPKLWNGRAVVCMLEKDGRERYFHGVFLAPEGMTHAKALKAIDKAFWRAVDAGRARNEDDECEDWNYDDVHDEMQKLGFENMGASTWREECA